MFFKKAIKHVEKEFNKSVAPQITNKKKSAKKTLNPDLFYEHYFSEVSVKKDIHIKNFYHPDKK